MFIVNSVISKFVDNQLYNIVYFGHCYENNGFYVTLLRNKKYASEVLLPPYNNTVLTLEDHHKCLLYWI